MPFSDGGIARRRAPGCTVRARRGRSLRRSRAPRRTCARRARRIRRPGEPRRARGPAWSPPARATRDDRRNRRGEEAGAPPRPPRSAPRSAPSPRTRESFAACRSSRRAPTRRPRARVEWRHPRARHAQIRPASPTGVRARADFDGRGRFATLTERAACCQNLRRVGVLSSRRVYLMLPRESRLASIRLAPTRLASSFDLLLASRLVRSGQCHTVCFTATPGYPLHTFPTSGCHPIAAGRRLGWV